ncbi:hypothetical protein FEM48_Zijuj01G0118800 [Ziziphus jujuba var. spinosa]|uniref:EamA domain-containing protein n=1 Tax=Ziziphus jujuba var. spinosa TaxID=714518 RepID=A0A978W141_ZIZJJ|nr:hypothetical protein FEM48_Zijuj01G0118800 [Ziziphus jujuba var. spinosa]
MGGIGDYKPAMAMSGLQFAYAGVALSTRAALLEGMNARVFVVYRQAIATLVIAPVAYFSRLEEVDIRKLRSIAKIHGTVLCVCGAVSMALLRGPKLLNTEHLPGKSLFGSLSEGENLLLGCAFLFASACCRSIWLILQVPISTSYPDHLSLSAWMCFLGTIQSATVTLFLEQDPEAWIMHSSFQLAYCFFVGIVGSGISFFVQAWCISRRGPLFAAMFNPLSTAMVTILAAIFLHEKIYAGGLVQNFDSQQVLNHGQPMHVKMSRWDGYKPAMAMIGLQCIYAGLALFTRAALLQGMSPRVFVVYRQALGTITMTPVACYSRWRDPRRRPFGLRSFYLIFVSSLIGMEKVNPRSFSSIAKIIGTVLCVGGAVSMALLKGPKLLNTQFLPSDSLFGNGGENLQLGCLFLFGSSCFWSFWIIMQVEISESCPDHFYSSIWICFLSSFQSAIFAVFIDHDFEAWQLNSVLEIGSCIYAGLATAVTFYVQAWCISKRGPLFCAMFNPLCTVITTIIAACFLHENLYVESLVGAFAVIVGLYVVLWGKAKDLEDSKRDTNPTLPCQEEIKNIHVLVDESSDKTNGKIDLEERLLAHQSNQTTLAD